jgi:hypothetical protein
LSLPSRPRPRSQPLPQHIRALKTLDHKTSDNIRDGDDDDDEIDENENENDNDNDDET